MKPSPVWAKCVLDVVHGVGVVCAGRSAWGGGSAWDSPLSLSREMSFAMRQTMNLEVNVYIE